MTHLPPNLFTTQGSGPDAIYLYPEPVRCRCIYVGNARAMYTYARVAAVSADNFVPGSRLEGPTPDLGAANPPAVMGVSFGSPR